MYTVRVAAENGQRYLIFPFNGIWLKLFEQ